MSGRRHPRSAERAAVTRKLVGAGAAGAAAVLAVAPMAHADANPKPSSTTTDTGHADAGGTAATNTVKPAAAPDYGFQKIRIGVQQKDGSWVPDGTTTAGTKLSIVETGPNSANAFGPSSCTTDASTSEAGSTETWCTFTQPNERNAAAKVVTPPTIPANQLYTALPGDTVTVTQTTVEPNLVIDPKPQTVQPCDLGNTPGPICADTQQLTFNDAGLPPVAVNDAQTVAPGGTSRITVLSNDTTKGAPATIKIVDPPAHGTATVVDQTPQVLRGARAAQRATTVAIVYTPNAGFYGHDSLRYSLTTANGTSIATVALRVAAPPTARDDSATTDAGTAVTVNVLANDHRNGGGALSLDSVDNPGHGTARISNGEVVYTPASGFSGTDTFTYVARNSLGTDTATVTITVNGVANTGVQSDELIALGALLLVTGGAATVAGRRRYRARHASAV